MNGQCNGPGRSVARALKDAQAETAEAVRQTSADTLETWPLDRLRDHPEQAASFHDLDGTEFDELLNSIDREGIKVPIEVTPEGVTIDGHQRRRAAEELGLTEVPVRVRYDLAGNTAAIERAHLEANLNRRQLDPLDRVRIARRLAEIRYGRPLSRLRPYEIKLLREELGDRLGLSPRHVDRLINISKLQMEIQKAFSAGRLKVVEADRVSRLPVRTQEKIAESIEAGEDPAQVVKPHLAAQKPARGVKLGAVLDQFLADLARGLDSLEGREEELPLRPKLDQDLALLKRSRDSFEVLEAALLKKKEEWNRLLAEFAAGIPGGELADADLDPAD